jgi:hypothetical protein
LLIWNYVKARSPATRYENVVAAYQIAGDEAALWEGLAALGFDERDIQWHVDNRGKRKEKAAV